MNYLKNKKAVFLILVSLVLILVFMSQTAPIDKTGTDADNIIGIWVSDAKDSKMEIYKSGDTYRGRLLVGWGNKLVETDGKTLSKDRKNPDAQLRNRTIANMEFISGVVFDDGEYKNGKLYAAQIGKSVNCTMRFNGEKLIMRIYIGFPLLGMTKNWNRVIP